MWIRQTRATTEKRGYSYSVRLAILIVVSLWVCRAMHFLMIFALNLSYWSDKEGPIHDFAWSPNSKEFGVVYGCKYIFHRLLSYETVHNFIRIPTR